MTDILAALALLSVFQAQDVSYPKMFHIGFIQKTAEQVRVLHARLETGVFLTEVDAFL